MITINILNRNSGRIVFIYSHPENTFAMTLATALDQEVDITHTDLSFQNFQFEDLEGTDFTGCDLRGSHFFGANLDNCIFTRANMNKASFASASMKNTQFKLGTCAKETNFTNADLTGAGFVDSILKGSKFAHANLTNAAVVRCDIRKVDVSGAIMTNSFSRLIQKVQDDNA